MASIAVVQRVRPDGRGRQPRAIEEVRDLCEELTARKAEAVALVNGLLPMVAFLARAALEVGPREYQASIAIAARLRRYRAQNEDDPEPDGLSVAA